MHANVLADSKDRNARNQSVLDKGTKVMLETRKFALASKVNLGKTVNS